MGIKQSAIAVMICSIIAVVAVLLAPVAVQAQEKTVLAAEKAAVAVEKTTLENLHAAFNGESNAHAKYLAFAQKADEEGYSKVASLFRAAAAAEQVHFGHHAEVIKRLGGTPATLIEKAEVKTTKENLEEALKGETYESTIMYPEFLAKAKKDGIADAVGAFEDAMAAEKVHADWYGQALAKLEDWKGTSKDFFVCPKCGNVLDAITGPTCPICMEDTRKFMPVS